MAEDNRKNRPQDAGPARSAGADDTRDMHKQRVPAEPVEQRPGEEPIGNGGTNGPPAFPPHN
jgi:hypothetical protein